MLPPLLFFLCLLEYATATPTANAILEPISDHDWPGMETRNALMSRSPRHAVALQQREHFVWGAQNRSSGSIYANMTLDTTGHDNTLVISTDRFAGKLKTVQCGPEITMVFRSNESYTDAIHDWEWVNFNDHRTFILITNYAGCGEKNTREPWVVSNARNDPANLTVHLKATKTTWEDLGKRLPYQLDIGHFTHTSTNMTKRNAGIDDLVDKVADKAKDIAGDVKDGTKKAVDAVQDKIEDFIERHDDKTFSLAHNFPPMILQKTTNKGLSLGIACNSCSTKGQLSLVMNLANINGKKKFSASISPKSFVADLPLTFTASGTLVGSWDKTFNILPTLALPGFSIPGLFTLGPNLQIEAGFSLSDVTGNIELHSGVEMRLPDSATATADFSNLKKGKISGWKPSFKAKKFSVGSAEVSALINFRTVIKVAITGKVLGDGVEVDVQLAIPTVNVKISAKHDPQGNVCNNPAAKLGVSAQATAGAKLSFEAYFEVLGKRKEFIDTPLFDKSDAFKFPEFCHAITGSGGAKQDPKKAGNDVKKPAVDTAKKGSTKRGDVDAQTRELGLETVVFSPRGVDRFAERGA